MLPLLRRRGSGDCRIVTCIVLSMLLFADVVSSFSSSFSLSSRPADRAAAVAPRYTSSAVPPPPPRRKGYVPKWKKKRTLADIQGPPKELSEIGLKGNIPVVFRQGNETKTTMALVGQPLRDVASQAGQFIKYGCGKGECGTCESLVNGQWIRPCCSTVPPVAEGEPYVVHVKETKAKVVSSGRFYSVRSLVLGFWNNLLGMVGFVRDRRLARQNWQERQSYEDLVRQRTLEKRRARLARETGVSGGGEGGDGGDGGGVVNGGSDAMGAPGGRGRDAAKAAGSELSM